MKNNSSPDLQSLTAAASQPDRQALSQWLSHAPTLSAQAWADVSQLCHLHQWPEFALAASEQALALAPDAPGLMSNHGFILRHCGQLDEAARWLDKSLALNPVQGEAQLVRAELAPDAPDTRLNALTEIITRQSVPEEDTIALCYAAARYAEELGHWDDMMQWLDRGAARKRAGFQYQVTRDETLLRCLAEAELPALPVDPAPAETARPLFIVGLPRTGTSLLESHLASHPDIVGAGELPHFNRALMQQFQSQFGRPPATPAEFVGKVFSLDLTAVGQRYLEASRRWSGARWFIDKLPINSLNLPLILAALPQAKVIHLDRDPRAMGFALYRQLFGRVYPFSYRQDELGRYVNAYRQLMTHWQPKMPQVQWLQYESAVRDWPALTRTLFDWLALTPVSTRAHGFSATASASQIRDGVHCHRIERWRQVEPHFQPYLAQLGK